MADSRLTRVVATPFRNFVELFVVDLAVAVAVEPVHEAVQLLRAQREPVPLHGLLELRPVDDAAVAAVEILENLFQLVPLLLQQANPMAQLALELVDVRARVHEADELGVIYFALPAVVEARNEQLHVAVGELREPEAAYALFELVLRNNAVAVFVEILKKVLVRRLATSKSNF